MGGAGWVEKLRIRLNSVQFQLRLPVGAELGNTFLLNSVFTPIFERFGVQS